MTIFLDECIDKVVHCCYRLDMTSTRNKDIEDFEGKAVHKSNQALRQLMIDLYHGNKCKRNRPLSLDLARLLGEAGEYSAFRLLAASYDWGIGVKRDTRKAFIYWKKASLMGDPHSQVFLAWAYDKGLGTEKDLRRAIYWYRKAARQGVAGAQYNLAQIYKEGSGVSKNPRLAFKWWLAAAKQGHAKAQTNTGAAYENGEGVYRDYKAAIKWYERAIRAGDELAKKNLVKLKAYLHELNPIQ
jgi:TPR repeat protein